MSVSWVLSGGLALAFGVGVGCSGAPGTPETPGPAAKPGLEPVAQPQEDRSQAVSSGEEPAAPAVELAPCDDPAAQLTCYCTSRNWGDKVAKLSNIVAPCYPSSVQTSTSIMLGLFSVWSWAAVSWPITKDRQPDYEAKFEARADHATVWETWKTNVDVFLPDGRKPPGPESHKRVLPAACKAIDEKSAKARYKDWEKVPADLPPRYLPTYVINQQPQSVIDKNGQPIRVEIVMNPRAFKYIYDHQLYSQDGQDRFLHSGQKLDFPRGDFGKDARGAQFGKAAWRVLGPADNLDDFHKSWAYVYPAFENGTMKDECRLVAVGLVGMHLISKLDQAPKWSWLTVEHAKNAPLRTEVARAGNDYLFYTPGCAPPRCAAVNQAPHLFPEGGTRPQLSNIVMEQTWGEGEEDNTPAFRGGAVWANAELAKALPNSVFRHYKLKGTQWFDDTPRRPTPAILANSLLEAYSQKESTCIGCHETAGFTSETPSGERFKETQLGDFVFVLREAKPELVIE